ncbi:MAG: Ig-like domain-containing protein, partial [Acidobacteria bacterium]|nr:Ig-like domain-containing protein [Acidobacteriota bacterium]
TDGTTTNSVSNLFWSTDNDAIATVSSSGLVTGVGPGTATITAASGSVSGTATVTVSVGNITSIMIRTNPQGQSTVKAGDQLQFQALATTSGGQTNLDVTNSVQWNVQEGSATGCCSISSTGLLTTMSGITGPVTVTAQDRLSGTTGQLAITIQ